MTIHPKKSKFMAINVSDLSSFQVDNIEIAYSESYTYLGSVITDDSAMQQMKKQLNSKWPHILKFMSFLRVNRDAPFCVERTVWGSALKSAIFYGCETWLTNDLRPAERPYTLTIKRLLGVKTSNPHMTLSFLNPVS